MKTSLCNATLLWVAKHLICPFMVFSFRWSGWRTRKSLTLLMTATSTSLSTTTWSLSKPGCRTRRTTPAWPRTLWPRGGAPLPRSSFMVRTNHVVSGRSLVPLTFGSAVSGLCDKNNSADRQKIGLQSWPECLVTTVHHFLIALL